MEREHRRTSLRLDAKGWQAAATACNKLLAELEKVGEAAARRRAQGAHAEGASDAAVVVMMFETAKLTSPSAGGSAVRRRRIRR